MDVDNIMKRVDRAIAAPIPVDTEVGGIALETMGQVMEFAKLMATSGAAVPPYLRGDPGTCLAICSRALRWQMDPFAVAEKSYLMKNKGGEERLGYEAQLIHAVINSRAPLKERLRHEIIGEGDERRCRVWGTFLHESKPHSYTSPTLKELRDARGRNEYGTLKGSPLWDSVPEVQLAYSTYRQWCRLYAPEVILGVYAKDELQDQGATVIEATPAVHGLTQRLRDATLARVAGRGFNAEHVNREASERSSILDVEKDGTDEPTTRSESQSVAEGRTDDAGDRGDRDRDQGGSGEARGPDQPVRDESAGREETQAEGGADTEAQRKSTARRPTKR